MAQPKLYDPKTVWESILTQMAEGHSLSAILRQEGMPSYSYCKEKLREDNELRRRYDQAIEDRADRLADELIALAWTPPPEGSRVLVTHRARIQCGLGGRSKRRVRGSPIGAPGNLPCRRSD